VVAAVTQDQAWVGWIAVLAFAFTGLALMFWSLERPGLAHGKGDLTLSRTLRRWLGVRPQAGRRFWAVPLFVLVAAGAVAGLLALIVHILL
jgi:hypothetical protein